jgi:hypothetical protein
MKKIAFIIAFTGLFLSSQAFTKPTRSGRPNTPYWSDQQKYLTDTLLARLAQITGNVAVNPTFQAATRSGRALYPYWFDQTAYLTDTLMKALSQFSGGSGGLTSFDAIIADDYTSILNYDGGSAVTIDSTNTQFRLGFNEQSPNTFLAGDKDSTAGNQPVTFRSIELSDLPKSVLRYNLIDVSNSGSAVTQADSFNVPARIFSEEGHSISGFYAGTTSVNGGTNMVVRFGGQVVANFSSIVISTVGAFRLEFDIVRLGTAKVRVTSTLHINGAAASYVRFVEATSFTFTNSLPLAFTIQSNVNASIVFKIANIKNNW